MGKPMATSQDFVNWVCGPELDADYLKFVLMTETESLLRFASGTTHQTIYYPEAKALHVLLPPRDEQREILGIVGGIHEKIGLNRKIGDVLSAMASALYKSWFVDFDPVHASLNGRRGIDEEIARLFPNSVEDSKLGSVPLGWRVGALEELVELRRGHDLPSTARRPGRVPVVSSSGVSGSHDIARGKAPGIVTGRYGTLGRVFMMEEDYWPLNTTLYSSDFKGHDPDFVFHTLARIDFEKYSDKGAVPGINRNHLHSERVLIPPTNVQRAFGDLAGRWRAVAKAYERQSVVLTSVRDTLLPRLLSGALHVNDAARSL
jgi:type I restriction enzyme S subunit